MTYRKKLIEVALPLEAINEASAREKSIRHGHPSTLHLWWARRPLAAARAVIFSSLVDDPDSPDALPAFVEACNKLPIGANVKANGDTPRMRLFDFIERLVTWEATTDDAILNTARELIQIATEGNPPPLLDPFAGGGSIPLEAQRLGLEAHASDLNPVAVMINKAQIEIPPRFANMPPVNPRDNALTPKSPLPQQVEERGLEESADKPDRWQITPQLRERMTEIARHLRKNATKSEDILWQALRNRQLDGKKFKRQVDIGAFVLDFYCAEERLAIEVDGSIHALQQDADKERQQLIESLGIRFVRLRAELVETNLAQALKQIQMSFKPKQQTVLPLSSRSVGEGAGGEGSLWRGAAGLAADVRYYGEWMREKAWERIGHLYPTHNGETVIAWIWARTVNCPNPACGAEMPLVNNFELSQVKANKAWLEPKVNKQTKVVRFEIRTGAGKPSESVKVGRGAKFRCLVCGEVAPEQYVKDEFAAKNTGSQLISIITEGQNKRNYYPATIEHQKIAEQAVPEWRPTAEIVNNPRHMTSTSYGMTEYGDLFSARQLTMLNTLCNLVTEIRDQILEDALASDIAAASSTLRESGSEAKAYAEAVSVYLAFSVDRLADKSSTLSWWMSAAEKMAPTFSRQALSMVWDYAEMNPFCSVTSNFGASVEWVAKAVEFLPAKPAGLVFQRDAAEGDDTANSIVISTDPPYYDNVPYADLSDFFYIWLRRSLGQICPEIFGTMLVPKQAELVADSQRYGGREYAESHFEDGLRQAFRNVRIVTSPKYPLSVYYAFKQAEMVSEVDRNITSTGWETMLTSLISSGFTINGTWPIRTERSGGLRNLNRNSLASSIILVCRPRPEETATISRRQFVDTLRRELPLALKEMQSGNIAPVDLAQASIGPGMAIYSRYSKVLEADGSPMSVRTALGLINQELDAYLAEQDGDIDGDTRFAVSWFEQFGFNEGEFGQADVLARAKNTSVAGVEAAGLVVSGRGKVRLVHWTEYDPSALTLNPSPTARSSRGEGLETPLSPRSVGEGQGVRGKSWNPQTDKRPTVWEATHHLIERLNNHGETGSAMLMTKMPHDMAAEARNLAYRLYSICERKGWADHARDYNALVISWAGIGEETARLREAAESGQATTQARLFDDA
jgi:putative DNA methylase